MKDMIGMKISRYLRLISIKQFSITILIHITMNSEIWNNLSLVAVCVGQPTSNIQQQKERL